MGTNSVRLLVVRINPNHSVTVLSRQKEVIRLGQDEFIDRHLRKEAMDRAVLVCRKFNEMSLSYGADEVIAVATSATREAKNRREFLGRLEQEAALHVRPISGREEARLIYLGVSSGLHLDGRLALFIDIGGGSTELIVGDERNYEFLESLQLGAIRLSNMFLAGETGPISSSGYATIRQHVRLVGAGAFMALRKLRIDLVVGSSGTIENLGKASMRRARDRKLERTDTVSLAQLKRAVRQMCALSLEERREVPGIDPDRADIIVGGAAILETVLEELRLPGFCVTERGLRDGMLVDYLAKTAHGRSLAGLGVRERSVLQLARSCGFDEAHARTVMRLSQELFDTSRRARLHRYGERERELLGYAALLHDIGMFLSFDNHHAHAHYLIRNAEMLGFDQEETDLLATIAFFHRKDLPKARHAKLKNLDREQQRTVAVLSTLLRLAESLDRSRAAMIEDAALRRTMGNRIELRLKAAGECHLELWALRKHEEAIEHAFGGKLVVKMRLGRRG
jgi:exopolyphosphatase/guanosine-5'-triphosphate,3'-diphosphate pyrophosphatase